MNYIRYIVYMGAFVLYLSTSAYALIQTNIQTDFNVVTDRDGESNVSVGAYKMFYRAQAQKEMLLLTEVVYHQESAIGEGEAEERFDIERLFIIYTLSPNYQFTIGRFHTNIGYWNSAFQRGRYFETTTTRPFIMGSNYIPIDYAGIELEAKLGQIGLDSTVMKFGIGSARNLTDSLPLKSLFLANSVTLFDVPTANLNIDSKIPNPNGISPNFSVTQYDFMFSGLDFGAGYFRNFITSNFSQDIYSGRVSFEDEMGDYELIGEYMMVDNDVLNTKRDRYSGYYAQAARNFYYPIFYEAQKVYARYENVKEMTILGTRYLEKKQRYIAGLSFEFNEVALLKFEVIHQRAETENSTLFAFQNAIYY